MAQYTLLKANGLSTFANPLSDAVAEGSFEECSNVTVNKNQTIEPRRGFKQYGTAFAGTNDRAKQLLTYKDTLFVHVMDKLKFDSGSGSFVEFTESVEEVRQGLRIKYIEANGNLYFTTNKGIKKISAKNPSDLLTSEIVDSGMAKALDIKVDMDFNMPGFLIGNSKVAYAVVWGYKDNNENLILGSPSSRTVVYNRTNDSCTTKISFAIPSEITTTDYFYQVYRTGVFTATLPAEPVDPGNEFNLIFEENVTASELTSGYVNTVDITPEDFRKNGTPLYTNPESGEGISQANGKPPFATDIATYKNYTFYANTSTSQQFNLSILGITSLVNNVSYVEITDGTSTNRYYFQGTMESYEIDATTMVPADFVNTVAGTAKYFLLDSANEESKYLVYFKNTSTSFDEIPTGLGRILVEVKIDPTTDSVDDILEKAASKVNSISDDFNFFLGSAALPAQPGMLFIDCSNNGAVSLDMLTASTLPASFVYTRDDNGTGEDALNNKVFLPRIPVGAENGPTPGQQLEQLAKSLINVVNQVDDIVYGYYNSGYDDVPGQMYFTQREITGPSFSFNSGPNTNPDVDLHEMFMFMPNLPTTGAQVSNTSTNEVAPNRIMFSKFQQPEAVPLSNQIDVGPKNREIKRIIPLRDSLFIFKEEGIYRLSGTDTGSFVVAEFDFSAQVLAPDSAVVMNNQIYALSNLGVIQVTDTGVEIISRPIEGKLLNIMREEYSYKTSSFGVSYETEKSYMLFVPTLDSDTTATQGYIYNSSTNTWVNWQDFEKTCGIVNFGDDKLYLGPADINQIEQERKTRTRKDQADREYVIDIIPGTIIDNTLRLNDISNVEVNDVIIQTIYLSIEQYNRVLVKLDEDFQVEFDNYYSELHAVKGDNIRDKIQQLANKMDIDSGINYSQFATLIGNYTADILDIVYINGNTVMELDDATNLRVGRYVYFNTNSTPFIIIDVTGNFITLQGIVVGSPTELQTDVNLFQDVQACFNLMVDVLNFDDGVFYTNYPKSTGSMDLESVIIEINKSLKMVTTKYSMNFLQGTVTAYKAIESFVIWNPSYFSDPSVYKQVTESTMIFADSNFTSVRLAYCSDLMPLFKDITFSGEGLGIGDWGYFPWGSINWGGTAAPVPLRTYIPRDVQRCRFIKVRFTHDVAFEKYSLYGLSLTYRPFSIKAYR